MQKIMIILIALTLNMNTHIFSSELTKEDYGYMSLSGQFLQYPNSLISLGIYTLGNVFYWCNLYSQHEQLKKKQTRLYQRLNTIQAHIYSSGNDILLNCIAAETSSRIEDYFDTTSLTLHYFWVSAAKKKQQKIEDLESLCKWTKARGCVAVLGSLICVYNIVEAYLHPGKYSL